ncbi:hypothetical protein [Streptomyces mirabilis]|uniref:hypothetical protein n=1 Tax=Streptomyces mirabilis TaxID=68239 RepID=UPI0036DD728B
MPTDTFGVSAAVLRESRRRAEAGDPRSKLRTSRHARATSSAVATAWWENWASDHPQVPIIAPVPTARGDLPDSSGFNALSSCWDTGSA